MQTEALKPGMSYTKINKRIEHFLWRNIKIKESMTRCDIAEQSLLTPKKTSKTTTDIKLDF